MRYVSSRNTAIYTDAPGAVLAGLAPDGGLFTVDSYPFFTLDEINGLTNKKYSEAAAFILSRFMEGYDNEELSLFTEQAYSRFSHEDTAPVVYAGENTWSLELFHGPTCAFKDFALQMLPRLLVSAAKKKGAAGETVILVATSGDTGKAALEGFKDVEGTKIGVFYPDGGVSQV
ncbi:MAG: threonine synthase, partial [Clostridia bacterium]|nr:threonine synthase [Clostridia bacterium]